MTTLQSLAGADPARLDAIPTMLRGRAQWVAWRQIERDGRPTKVPINPRTGGNASSTDPATWATFEDAVAAVERPGSPLSGLGFVVTAIDAISGVDLDKCIDDSGEIAPTAMEIIDGLNSYAEISPSGRGVRVFVLGDKPAGSKCKVAGQWGGAIEVYDRERFFTVTGRHLAGTPTAVESRQAELHALCRSRLMPAPSLSQVQSTPGGGFRGEDADLIRRMCASTNGAEIDALLRGEHAGDHSSADLSLCNHLAWYTGRDAVRVDRLFRQSGLMRPKWDERRGDSTYGQWTIAKAIADTATAYSGRRPPPSRAAETTDVAQDDDPADAQAVYPLGERDLATGCLVLSPKRTLPTAVAYHREFHDHPDARTLHSYGGVLYEWAEGRYVPVEDEAIRHRLQPWLHAAKRCHVKKDGTELVNFDANPGTVKSALDSIRDYAHLSASTPLPCWLDERPDRLPVRELLPCRTGIVHIPSGRVVPATPALFTTCALDFDFDPDAPPPTAWLAFLDQLWPDDADSINLVREWFGYSLTGDTGQQKALLVVGPPRSGKGTIARVLTRLAGAGNVVGPTTGSLAGPFGLQPLIGKSLAIVSDARFTGEGVSVVTERLLTITGEDTLTIDRKHLPAATMRLPTRFVFLTNELPRLTDASTALAKRFLILALDRSFYGQEDPGLTDRLLGELPGILNWALAGWKTLNARGRFVQPASGEEAVQELEDLASPVRAFVRERCDSGPGLRVWLHELFTGYKAWCERDGRVSVPTRTQFGRDLAAAVPGIKRRRATGNIPYYEGLAFKIAG